MHKIDLSFKDNPGSSNVKTIVVSHDIYERGFYEYIEEIKPFIIDELANSDPKISSVPIRRFQKSNCYNPITKNIVFFEV